MAAENFLDDMPVQTDGLVLIGYGNGANTKHYTALVSKKVLTEMENVRTTEQIGYQIEEQTEGILLAIKQD